MDFHSVESGFQDAVAQGVFPGAVVLVSKDGGIVFERPSEAARSFLKNALKPNTIFDLASLTKPLATTIAIMLWCARKDSSRRPDHALYSHVRRLRQSTATFRQMLNHSSGLPAGSRFTKRS
jgi:CubicO group peptidase (beta-lactamase class C family)